MALSADQHDYSRAFDKHYKAYCEWKNDGHLDTQILILFYCVECGLKFLLMRKYKIYRVKDANDFIGKILTSHDLYIILKELRMMQFNFPNIKTKHNDDVSLKEYHQMRRYCIEAKSNKENEICKLYDENLRNIVQWVHEERWSK